MVLATCTASCGAEEVAAPQVLGSSAPRLLHQTWKAEEPPAELAALREGCLRRAGADWQHYFWTDSANRNLVSEHYRWFLPTYDQLPRSVMRADVARYMYLHHFGGVYLDLDVHCLRSPDVLLAALSEPEEGASAASRATILLCPDPDSLSNAVMASLPGAPLWIDVLEAVSDAVRQGTCIGPTECTGPHLLTRVADKRPEDVAPCDSRRVFPYPWQYWALPLWDACHPRDTSRCAEYFPEAWTVHFWVHTWLPVGEARVSGALGSAAAPPSVGEEL